MLLWDKRRAIHIVGHSNLCTAFVYILLRLGEHPGFVCHGTIFSVPTQTAFFAITKLRMETQILPKKEGHSYASFNGIDNSNDPAILSPKTLESKFPSLDRMIAVLPLCSTCCLQSIPIGSILALYHVFFGLWLWIGAVTRDDENMTTIILYSVYVIQPLINSIPVLHFYASNWNWPRKRNQKDTLNPESQIWIGNQSFLFTEDCTENRLLIERVNLVIYSSWIGFVIMIILEAIHLISMWTLLIDTTPYLVLRSIFSVIGIWVIQFPNIPMSITMHLYFTEIGRQIHRFRHRLQHIESDDDITSLIADYRIISDKVRRRRDNVKYWLSGGLVLVLAVIWWNIQLMLTYDSFVAYLESFGWDSDIGPQIYFLSQTILNNFYLIFALALAIFAVIPILDIADVFAQIKHLVIAKSSSLLRETSDNQIDGDALKRKVTIRVWFQQLSIEMDHQPAVVTIFGFAVDIRNFQRLFIPFMIARASRIVRDLTPIRFD